MRTFGSSPGGIAISVEHRGPIQELNISVRSTGIWTRMVYAEWTMKQTTYILAPFYPPLERPTSRRNAGQVENAPGSMAPSSASILSARSRRACN